MMLPKLLSLIALPALAAANCKTAPGDAAWPSIEEWSALNQSIGGSLIRTAPAASSCYAGNPLSSPYNCSSVKDHWSYAAYHAAWPESNDYSIYNNNSCVPPGVSGYTKDKGCSIGGLPQYIVNATTEEQVATAMSWASQRNIRIVVKSTGHDLNGRYVSHHYFTPSTIPNQSNISSAQDQPAHTRSQFGRTTSNASTTTQPGISPAPTKPQTC